LSVFKVKIDDAVKPVVNELKAKLKSPGKLMREVAGLLEFETEQNLRLQGRPAWAPLSKATKAARLKRNKGSSVLRILQNTGRLAASVSSQSTATTAEVGAATVYAAIHQLGGTVNQAARSQVIKFRTKNGKSLFAKKSAKRATAKTVSIGQRSIKIPARPYLPFTGSIASPTLQPEASRKMLEIVAKFLTPQ
jgi:phage virion morphogenesis protein